MESNLIAFILNLVINIIIVSPVLWLAGRALVGKENARFSDSVLIIIAGNIVGAILGAFIVGMVGFIIQLVLWLALIKHFFDCGWLRALAIAILSLIIGIIIAVVLGIVGFTLFATSPIWENVSARLVAMVSYVY